jgi:hypothetical protein
MICTFTLSACSTEEAKVSATSSVNTTYSVQISEMLEAMLANEPRWSEYKESTIVVFTKMICFSLEAETVLSWVNETDFWVNTGAFGVDSFGEERAPLLVMYAVVYLCPEQSGSPLIGTGWSEVK